MYNVQCTFAMMETQLIFNNPVNQVFVENLSKTDFVTRKRVAIEMLHPNQKYIDDSVLAEKIKGHNHTTPYVLCLNGINVLYDGHHTVAAKKINGQKYIIALFHQITI